MDKCWANSLGNCSKKISGEHLISKGIFKNRTFSVKGFAWCKNEFKSVGINSITRKCLCVKHNEDLSPVDTEGKKLFDSLDQIAGLTSKTITDKNTCINETINGYLLERWFLKTLINLSYNSGYLIGEFGEKNGVPHKYLVDVSYGITQFSNHLGLYTLVLDGDLCESNGEISFTPFVNDKGFLGGGVFSFRGIDFFLSLVPAPHPKKLADIKTKGLSDKILQSKLIYRCPKMEWSINGKACHCIKIKY